MKNQKEEFFELIYAQYAKKLERICLRYVNYQPEYREIAADSVQKTFLKALEEYDKLKDASYIEPWLYQTCMHRFTTALKTYRRRMKHHVVIDEKMENVLSVERTITTIDALLDKESNIELLNRVFDAFTDRERSIAQKEFCQGIFSRCAPSLYITSSWRLLTCTKIENNIKMNRICMTIKSCRCGQSAIELNQAD